MNNYFGLEKEVYDKGKQDLENFISRLKGKNRKQPKLNEHSKAWKMFGKEHCEICGRSLEEEIQKIRKRLSIHNTLQPKDYTIIESYAWKCLCSKCHWKEESSKGNNIN